MNLYFEGIYKVNNKVEFGNTDIFTCTEQE